MSPGAQVALLESDRLHLHHGPIDVIVSAEGPKRKTAFSAVAARFDSILPELVDEMAVLTEPYRDIPIRGSVARRMLQAVAPLAKDRFVTPMAAVAGAVADELAAVLENFDLSRFIVNDGGDIAFSLTKDQVLTAASPVGTVLVQAPSPARGLATSGWRGRSQSLGIADAVTILAETAARADAAATLIANAVDIPGHPAIARIPAADVEAVPQLGSRLVTADVGPLSKAETWQALNAGEAYARSLLDRDLILGAALLLQGQVRLAGSIETTPLIQKVSEPSALP